MHARQDADLRGDILQAMMLGQTVDQLAHTITIYPSISGSVAEAARQLMQHQED